MRRRHLLFFGGWIGTGVALALALMVIAPGLVSVAPPSAGEVAPPPVRVDRPGPIGPESYAAAVSMAAPAVVNIHTSKPKVPAPSPLQRDPFFRRFFEPRPDRYGDGPETSLGSGVIIDASGYIVTNHHLIRDADEIRVMLQDGREALADVVGVDPETDLAALRVNLPNLPSVAIGTSSPLRVGDVVLAIGNPFGVGQTVTMGIVSATGRTQLGLSTFENFIQTDAAINPGNSGGALINARGELVGINTAIVSETGGYQGIGLAIPTRLVHDVMGSLLERGYVARGWLGIEVRQLTPDLAETIGLPGQTGVAVARVFEGSPARAAGLRAGDVIVALDGDPVDTFSSALDRVTKVKPGTELKLTVVRQGKTHQLAITVSQRPVQEG